ncbi:hypothetical protein [Pseudomonas gingeri]|uniref:Uncharacterized protein n=1 Tax=Pseudomonas gingeri TaxID=117681 RepID=A0A7Y8BQ19_9PSED|nr:hypothetical protein [Pseudomonas gingeri]NWB51283.1 hypothetical protein [Pseudomonas gingeri]
MLVYLNKFKFEPENGIDEVIGLVAKWLGKKTRRRIESALLAKGAADGVLNGGWKLKSRATLDSNEQPVFPYFFCAQLSHRDEKIAGRDWFTEIGIKQQDESSLVECTVLLRVEEVSARVKAPIQVTRPKFVVDLVEHCRPTGDTPGLYVKKLIKEEYRAYLHEVERPERSYPIILVSSSGGTYAIDPDRLRTIVVGLASVVAIPGDVDTFELEGLIGRRYIAFGGAIKVILPMRSKSGSDYAGTILFRPEDLDAYRVGAGSIESEILGSIVHYSNLRLSWQHVSIDRVSHEVLRSKLQSALSNASGTSNSAELDEYVELLVEADRDIKAKEEEILELRDDVAERVEKDRAAQAKIESLTRALSGRRVDDVVDEDSMGVFVTLRDGLWALQKDAISLEQTLRVLSILYADRLVVQETAFKSAGESDRGGFKHSLKAYELLVRLVTLYWQVLESGGGDQKAKEVFGSSYTANEASLSNDGKRRRTFNYKGKDFLMERHLKIGVKDSLAETLRVHFEWVAQDKKIIVGHCGKHLDF